MLKFYMSSAKATIWEEAPELATPESPALFYGALARGGKMLHTILRQVTAC